MEREGGMEEGGKDGGRGGGKEMSGEGGEMEEVGRMKGEQEGKGGRKESYTEHHTLENQEGNHCIFVS